MGNKRGKTLKKGNSFYEKGEKIKVDVPVIPKGKAKKLHARHKILILCEGQTEVNYFNGITKSETYKQQLATVYTVVVEMPESNQAKNLLLLAVKIKLTTTQTTKKNVELITSLQDFFEKSLSAQEAEKAKERLYYESKAQEILAEDSTPFDQIWLVFDNDDNEAKEQERLQQLFATTRTFNIDIAYSNRQFENWILLHFKQNTTVFLASECKNASKGMSKNELKSSKNCRCGYSNFSHKSCVGTDCKGAICIGGYLRENKLHPCYLKGDWRKNGQVSKPTREYCYEGLFHASVTDFLNATQEQEQTVFGKIRTAITNAECLRQQSGDPTPENAANPYTNVDILVKKLIN